MTDSNTDLTVAGNGTSPEDTKPAPEQIQLVPRERGIARLREEEAYFLTSMVLSALNEAEHLVREINQKASDRFPYHRDDRETPPLEAAEVVKVLGDAYQCTAAALSYIDNISMRWLVDEPDAQQ